jgi:glutamate--cysteine ligase
MIKVGKGSVSLEPGGQVEMSFPPVKKPSELIPLLDAFIAKVDQLHEKSPYRCIHLGHQPVSLPDEITLRSKPRYRIMDRKLRAAGKLGVHMMRATAGMQVTVDYRSEPEAVETLRVALITAPLVTGLFANSPWVGGEDSGYASFRERVWWHTDSKRCAVPGSLVRTSHCLAAYIDFALDADLWFLKRDGVLVECPGRVSFRDALSSGEPLTLDDFALHATTLFPAARIRNGVEVRSADSVPPQFVPSFAALMAGLLYDEAAREAALELHPYRCDQSINQLHEESSRRGVRGRLEDGFSIGEACLRMVELSRKGLKKLVSEGFFPPEEARHLDVIQNLLNQGLAPADLVLERGLEKL